MSDPAKPDDTKLPAIDFSTFILSLSHSALVHLGEVPVPGAEARERDDFGFAHGRLLRLREPAPELVRGLRVVAEGETILITENGQVIAEIRPPRSPGMPQEPNDT